MTPTAENSTCTATTSSDRSRRRYAAPLGLGPVLESAFCVLEARKSSLMAADSHQGAVTSYSLVNYKEAGKKKVVKTTLKCRSALELCEETAELGRIFSDRITGQ